MIALIPARAGSQRVPRKAHRLLNGHPVLAYTIAAARQSGVFDELWLCTDDEALLSYVPPDTKMYRRDPVPDHQADIVWIRAFLGFVGRRPTTFAILRPTSPFRTAKTIQRAFRVFSDDGTHDSVRAVEAVKEHPGKMWEWAGPGYPITPLLSGKRSDGVPWHSCPTQTLPPIYIQNSSLEMAWTANVEVHGMIHGRKVAPFFTEGLEGLTIDTEDDWARAVQAAVAHPECLPVVDLC